MSRVPAVYPVIEQFLNANLHFVGHFVLGQTQPERSATQKERYVDNSNNKEPNLDQNIK